MMAMGINYSSMIVQWKPLSGAEFGGVPKGYRVLYTNNTGNWNNLTVDTSQVELVITGLSSYTNYTVKVAGISSKGEGLWSLPALATTQG